MKENQDIEFKQSWRDEYCCGLILIQKMMGWEKSSEKSSEKN